RMVRPLGSRTRLLCTAFAMMSPPTSIAHYKITIGQRRLDTTACFNLTQSKGGHKVGSNSAADNPPRVFLLAANSNSKGIFSMKLATLLSAMMLALSPMACAQTVTGSVTGTVADAAD